MEFQSVPNEAASASGGAGIQAAQRVSSLGAEVLVTGSVGPNAYPALEAADIKIMTGAMGTIESAVESFKHGTLSPLTTPGPMHKGMGGRGGRGRGRGGRGRRDARRGGGW
jgi:predicted Fe-Mo cluster-binding NifX family protein